MSWAAPASVDRFDEAVDWFLSRTPLTSDQAKKLSRTARQDAFWVGGSLQADQVQRVMDSIAEALESGEPFDEWRKRVRNDLFNDAHAETVFQNAMQRSYNAGRWEQMHDPDVAELRPFLVFDAILDDRTSTICRACDNTVLHRDDPWWETHIPPLHHRCRSSIRSIRKQEAGREGVTINPTEQEPDGDWGAVPTAANGWKPDRDRYDARLRDELERKRTLREEPTPETPHEADKWAERYKDRYGSTAGRAVGWGRASLESGLDMPIEEVREQLQRLPKTGSTRGMLQSLEGADGTLRRSGGELDPMRRAAAGMAGHLKAVRPRLAVDAPGLPKRGAGKRAQEFFSVATGPDVTHPEDWTFQLARSRAAAVPELEFIRYRSTPGILEHEWSHALEHLNPKMLAAAEAFREARTAGERLKHIKHHELSEVGKEDEFLHHYIGKFYDFPATEVTSMGVELLVAGRAGWGTLEQLLRKDPEHFFFVLGQLAG